MFPSNVTFNSTTALVDPMSRFWIAKPLPEAMFSANTVFSISNAPTLYRAPPVAPAKRLDVAREQFVGTYSGGYTLFYAHGHVNTVVIQ